jgi:hypothetical protein
MNRSYALAGIGAVLAIALVLRPSTDVQAEAPPEPAAIV